MTEYEKHKDILANILANMDRSNVDMVVDAIEVMIDIRIGEALSQLSDRLEASIKPKS